ncbi:hypothetical protein Pmar_PMAR027657, partial [Perkinsus marinus ATCC 50983]
VQRLMDYGIRRRVVGATNMNSHSSRSHAVFTVRLESKFMQLVSLNSRLNLVDLSGSERSGKTGAEGEVM